MSKKGSKSAKKTKKSAKRDSGAGQGKNSRKQKTTKTGPRPDATPTLDMAGIPDAPVLDPSTAAIGNPGERDAAAPQTQKSSFRKESRAATGERADMPPDVERDEQAGQAEGGVLGIESNAEIEREPLRLPRGAFIALRKSGGFQFSTSEVVVYPDGRVAFDARGVPQKEYNRLPRALNDAQIMSLRKQLDQTGFWRAEGGGSQPPDGYAYEITARLGQRANSIEVFDGSVPEALRPLLDRLTGLLPSE
jgi:hypothetical protein